jgi:hypothetical protein|nr:MAG TPA: hypothetical protein [Caudoviricetes sp.]
MELNLTPVSNIEVNFTFSVVNKEKGFNGNLTFKTVANKLNNSLVTVSTDNAFYNALFGGLLGETLSEEDEQKWNNIFDNIESLKVFIKDTDTNKEKEMTFYSLWSKAAVIECDTVIAEMLNYFNE